MADKVKVWFDAEGDFLEVIFSDAPGYMRETKNDAVMQRVDEHGRVLGVSKFQKDHPLEAAKQRMGGRGGAVSNISALSHAS